jgi:ABC-type branched-subunit amino acid transport system ATPase component
MTTCSPNLPIAIRPPKVRVSVPKAYPLGGIAHAANSERGFWFPWAEVAVKTVEKPKPSTQTDSPSSLSRRQVLLRVQDLHKRFGGQTVLNRVSVELGAGEVVLLRGANGSGKTTLLNILTGNLEPDAGAIELRTNGVSEVFRYPRRWWNLNSRLTPEQVAQAGIGRTWQDIRLFSTQNLLDNIACAAPNQLGENPAWALLRRSAVQEQEKRNINNSQAMLWDLGLADRETSSADKVSLGQSKRVAIARAIQAGARILFLDEPLSGLDGAGIAEVMAMLNYLAKEHNVTLVIVEHVLNIPRILDLATTVWTLEDGNITVESPEQVRYEVIKTSSSSFPNWINILAGETGKILHQTLTGGAVLSTIVDSEHPTSSVALSVEDLVVYRGKRLVIGETDKNGEMRGLSFKLYKGQINILQAPNGWGKTTLMEAIAGLIPIHQGSIQIDGQSIEALPPWERVKLGLSLLQSRDHTCLNLTVREALNLARVHKVPHHVSNLLSKKVSNLSGGERQKLAFYCAIPQGEYLLMDEPFSALDNNSIFRCIQQLNSFKTTACLIAIPKMNILNLMK